MDNAQHNWTVFNFLETKQNKKKGEYEFKHFFPPFGNLYHTPENTHIKMVLSNSSEIKCLVLLSLEYYKFSHY